MIAIVRRILIGMLTASLTLSAADMMSGTWKLNTAKSKYSPGPAPRSHTITTSMDGDWVVTKLEAVSSDGKATSYSNRYKFDGQEYPYKTPSVDGMASFKRIDDRHAEATIKGSKGNASSKWVISQDGKKRTITTTGMNADGKPLHNVSVYDKQ